MKTALILAATLLGSSLTYAAETPQDASVALPDVAAETATPAPEAAVAPPTEEELEPVPQTIPIPLEDGEFAPGVIDEPLPLIPNTPYGGLEGGFGPRPDAVMHQERAVELRQKIRIRELQTVAQEQPNVRGQRELADKAETFEGRRTAMRNYYTLLAKAIIAKDKSLKEPVEKRLNQQLRALEQRHVRPSRLIEPIAPVPGSQIKTRKRDETDS